ncbi:MAG: tRNA (guanosine(46)-N7)-methyltransferase TrmB [Bacilli bacterium]
MRLRNVKNKDKIITSSLYFVSDSSKYKGKWHLLFGNNNPLYIEIGMGKGKFIINNALKNPDINFIGIERVDNVLVKAIENVNEFQLSNLKLIRLDAVDIDNIFDVNEIKRIYLNFSDPWPKKRHSKRRLTYKTFLSKYDMILNGEIHIKTDNRSLFEYSIESLSEYGYKLKNVYLDLTNSNILNNITTEYEDKYILENKTIYKLEAYKNKN